MVPKTKIFIVRHGKSEGNLRRCFQGRDDTPLSQLGARQAEMLRDRLKHERIDAVYHSPLVRAKRTAEIVFGPHGKPLVEYHGLIERDFGKLDGMPVDEAKKTYPDAEEFYQGRTTEIDAPGVEAIPILQKRSADAIRRIAAQNKGKNIGVVSHLFWTKALLSELLGQPFSEIQKTRVGTASLTTIEAVHTPNGIKFVVSEIGDERHLERLKT